MKKVFYLGATLAFAMTFTSCNKHDEQSSNKEAQNLELRAKSLGFADASAYNLNVAEQCALGNHDNCDILNNGTHQACAYADHSGANHDGTAHNGSSHGTHDANGHSHGQGNGGNHNGGRH